MKNFYLFIFSFIFIFIFSSNHVISQNKEINIYVSKMGNDNWSGKLPEPNQGKSDGPFSSIEAAKVEIRKIKKSNPSTKIIVSIREGIYPFQKTIEFTEDDAGSNDAQIIWKAYQDDKVYFTGNKIITGFVNISDPDILKRIDKSFHSQILVTNLKAQGIKDFGNLPSRIELIFKDKPMTIARYPNKGWLKIDDVPQTGEKLINKGDIKVIKFGLPAGKHFGRFISNDPKLEKWLPSKDMWMHGYWCWDWKDEFEKIEKIDTKTHEIFPSEPYHWYGYEKDQRFYFLNILEELDTPGEYYLDVETGLLYFWPPSPIKEGDVSITVLNKPMLHFKNTSYVSFQNITFKNSKVRAVEITGGSNNSLKGCIIKNIGADTGVIIHGGTKNGISSCDIYDVGAAGCTITGGDRFSLTPSENYAINNHIYRFARILRAFQGAIWLSGVGNIVAHNKIHDAPFSGIQFYGNDNIIEFNEIYDIAHEAGDVGGVNTGGDWSHQGTQIRYNYFHHLHGPGNGGIRAVYLDLPGSNMTIYGNVFYDVDIGVFFNSGRDNVVQNNEFIECNPSVNIYIWPFKSYFHIGGAWKIVEKLHEINYKNPPYSTKYPKLPTYLDSVDLGLPYGNVVINNISCGGKFLDLSEQLDRSRLRVENNLIADTMVLVLTKKHTPDYDPYNIGYAAVYRNDNENIISELTKSGNVITNDDLGFVDLKNGNFQLKDSSPAFKLGFKKIPIEKIGLNIDKFRKSLP